MCLNHQGVTGQSPQGYQVNSTNPPQACQPNMAQSPRSYQPAQSPNYAANSGLSPPGYRQVQSQSPPVQSVHAAMQYHHSQQVRSNRFLCTYYYIIHL